MFRSAPSNLRVEYCNQAKGKEVTDMTYFDIATPAASTEESTISYSYESESNSYSDSNS